MKLAAFIAGAILLQAAMGPADTIYLKSGRTIQCDSAWEEGKEVKYTVAEGTVGIPRSMVARIVKGQPPAPQTATASKEETPTASKPREVSNVIKEKLAASYSRTGMQQFEKKDYVGALEDFQKAYDTYKNQETTFNLAVAYYYLKDDWNASLLFNDVIRSDPRNTEALNYLGEIAWRNENLDEAQAHWENSYRIKKDPEIKQRLARLKKEKNASAHYDDSNTRHFLMKYDGGSADPVLVSEMTDFLEFAYRQLSVKFEEYPNAPFVVVLYPQQDFFNITEAPNWSGGINDGKIKVPLRGLRSLNDELKRVLMHELSHSFIQLKTEGNCPVWLHEGIAQYFEGKRPAEEASTGLRKMAEKNALPRMEQLGGSFLNADPQQASVLYLLSLSFTQYLIERHHFYKLNSMLEAMGKGADFEKAFEESYLVPVEQMESEWRRALMQD